MKAGALLISLLILQGQNWAAPAPMEFRYIEPMDIEQAVLTQDNLFVLFFDRRDGSTEDLHRDFLKAAGILQSDKIKINVLECNERLSTRQEDRFRVFKYPKIKFFQLGRLPHSYSGGLKVPHIVAWVKKILRKKHTESLELASFEELLRPLSGEDSREFMLFYGQKESVQFEVYERVARTRLVRFFWSSNPLVWRVLETIAETGLFNSKRFPLYDEEVHKSLSQYEQRIYQSLQLEEEPAGPQLDKVYYIRKLRFTHESIFLVDSLQHYDINGLKLFLKNRVYPIVENIYALKQVIETKTSEEEKIYLVFLYNRPAFSAIKDNLREIIEAFTKRFIVAFVDLDAGNSYYYLEIFKYDKDSIFILEQKKNEQFIRKYKIDVNYNHYFVDTARDIEREYLDRRLQEYIKSRDPASVNFTDSLFTESVGLNYEQLVFGGYHNVLVIFYRQDDARLAQLMSWVKKYENFFYHFRFLRINIDENEVRENLQGRIFPFVKIYYGERKTLAKSIGYTPDENAFVAFIKSTVISDEL